MAREGDAWTQGQRHRQRARQSEDGRRGSLGRTPQATALSCILMIANLNLRSHSAALSHTCNTHTPSRRRWRQPADPHRCVQRPQARRRRLQRLHTPQSHDADGPGAQEGEGGGNTGNGGATRRTEVPTRRLNPLNHHAWHFGQPLSPPSRPFTLAAARTQHTRTTRTHLRAASLRRPSGCGSSCRHRSRGSSCSSRRRRSRRCHSRRRRRGRESRNQTRGLGQLWREEETRTHRGRGSGSARR